MRATLIGNTGPVAGREFALEKSVTTIGRRDENDIVVKDPTVSRKHAEIHQEGDALVLRDRGSTSGTLVNGAAIEGDRRLRDGDTITVGSNASFKIQIAPEEGATVIFSRDDPGSPQPPPPAPPSQAGPDAAATAATYRESGHTSIIPPFELTRAEPEEPPFPPPPPRDPKPLVRDMGSAAPLPPPVFQEPPPPSTWSPAPGREEGLRPLSQDWEPPSNAPRGDFGAAGSAGSWSPPTQPPAGQGAGQGQPGAQFPPPPGPPAFTPPPPAAAPATTGSRRGLVIGLTVLLILALIVIAIVALLVFSRLR